MSPSANYGIGTLPLELITKVLESLPWKDVVRTRQVSRIFDDALKESASLQYKIELIASGMSDMRAPHLDIPSKLKLLRSYRSKWIPFIIREDLGMSSINLPFENPRTIVFPGGMLQSNDDKEFIMAQGPSELLGIIGTTRTISLDIPVSMISCEPEEDLMVVVYQDQTDQPDFPKFYARLLNMCGNPHRLAQAGEIMIPGPPMFPEKVDLHFAIRGEKICVLFYWIGQDGFEWRITTWNWHNGESKIIVHGDIAPLLNLPEHPKQHYKRQAFLHNNRTVIASGILEDQDGNLIGAALDIFETNSPGEVENAIRLHLPAFAPDWVPSDFFEVTHRPPTDNSANYHRNPPFQIAEDQTILLVGIRLDKGEESSLVQFLVSSGNLLSFLRGERADTRARNIPWDEWGPQSTRAFLDTGFTVVGARAYQVQVGDSKDRPTLAIADFARSVSPFPSIEEIVPPVKKMKNVKKGKRGKAKKEEKMEDIIPAFATFSESTETVSPAFRDPIITALPYYLWVQSWFWDRLIEVSPDTLIARTDSESNAHSCLYFSL